MNREVSVLLLAAGQSSRMHQAKQLLPWGNGYLLEHMIETLSFLPVAETCVVLGHQAEQIKERIQLKDVRCSWLVNPDYALGLSSSLKKGLAQALAQNYQAVFIMLGDLPLIQRQTLELIWAEGCQLLKESKEPFIVQVSFQNRRGHPLFLGNISLVDWQSLEGDQGLKSIFPSIKRHKLVEVNDRGIVFDIDTPELYARAKAIWEKESRGDHVESSRNANPL